MKTVAYSIILFASIFGTLFMYQAVKRLKDEQQHLNSLVLYNNELYRKSIDRVVTDLLNWKKAGQQFAIKTDSFFICHPLGDTSLWKNLTSIAQFHALKNMYTDYEAFYHSLRQNLNPSLSEGFAIGVLNDKENFIQLDFFRKDSMNFDNKKITNEKSTQLEFNYDETRQFNDWSDFFERDSILKQRWGIPFVKVSK